LKQNNQLLVTTAATEKTVAIGRNEKNRQPEAALPEAVMAMSATTQSAVIATARGQKIKHKRKQSCGGDNSCNNQPASTKNSNWHPHKKP